MVSSIAPADQIGVPQAIMVNGVMSVVNVTNAKLAGGASNVYKFNADYVLHVGPAKNEFRHGGIYILDTVQKAALIAAGAPMTQQ